jgi:hypothetical protein
MVSPSEMGCSNRPSRSSADFRLWYEDYGRWQDNWLRHVPILRLESLERCMGISSSTPGAALGDEGVCRFDALGATQASEAIAFRL